MSDWNAVDLASMFAVTVEPGCIVLESAGVTAGPGGSFRLRVDASSKYYEIADARVDDGEAVVMLDAHEGTLRADETRTLPTVVRWRLPPGAWDIVGYHPTARYEASITIAPRDDVRGASAQIWTRAAKGGAT